MCFLAVALPLPARAAVVINEVAWMGTTASANDEWIELYNDGSEVLLDGWRLSDGVSLEISLSGTIASGQYAVLERTDDSSSPAAAFLVYTGALSNAGATLALYDDTGAVVDQVAGGENWEVIGGDNTTKETAQLTSAGWVTAKASPGAPNQTTSTSAQGNTNVTPVESSGNTTLSKTNTATKVPHIEPDVSAIKVEVPTQAYVNQTVRFTVTNAPSRRTYEWNFGDLVATTSKSVTHRYRYPGNYVVTLAVIGAKETVEHRATITVLPTILSLTKLKNGDIQIHNDAKYEIDISGYHLGSIAGMTVPPRTIILPNSTLTIPGRQLGAGALAMLYDEAGRLVYGAESVPEGTQVARTVASEAGTSLSEVEINSDTSAPKPVSQTAGIPFAWAGEVDEVTSPVVLKATTSPSITDKKEEENIPQPWPQYAMVGLLMVAVLGVYTRYL